MELPEKLQAFLETNPLDEDGEPFETQLLPGMPLEEIQALEQKLGFSLPEATRKLLEFTSGIEGGPMEIIEFAGEPIDYLYILEPRKTYLQLSPDGFGNVWFYDFDSTSNDVGPIYYYMHEGPVISYQCRNIFEFMEEVIHFMTPPFKSLIDDVHEFRIKPIKELNQDLMAIPDARNHNDQIIRDFSRRFDDHAFLYDFRNSIPGDGFDMRKLRGIARHDEYPIYALEPRPSIFSKIAGLFKK